MTVGEMFGRMDAAEFNLWRHYFRRNGFEADRQVWTTARAGSAAASAWGGKVSPGEIVPKFEGGGGISKKTLVACLSALPGAQVTRYG